MSEEKPIYRVPSMAEVAATEPNGLEIVSTFSGCGGSCLGFEMAGYRVRWANEFVPAARETYAANHPGVILDGSDVREITAEHILAAIGKDAGEIDVLEGSPPCASFSTAGKRAKDWGKVKKYSDVEQRTDDLFFEYVRLLRGLRPRSFVAENVSGLVKGVAKGYFKEILREMKASGYRVEARLLDAQWLGVPQARQRIIFVGIRGDLGIDPVFPKPLPYRYSVRDAIGDLANVAKLTGGKGAVFDQKGASFNVDQPIATIVGGQGSRSSHQFSVHEAVDPETGQDLSIERFALAREWQKAGEGGQSEKYLNLQRAGSDKPLPTVTAMGGSSMGVASVTHATEPRKFTLLELRRLCSFPDDFVLTGTYAQGWERLGRSVPPLMMKAVAAELAKVLS